MNLESELIRHRKDLTDVATKICACSDERCGEPHIDAFLRWESELVVIGTDRPGYAGYVETVRADATIAQEQAIINACWVTLTSKPWAQACQRQLDRAAAAFARKAHSVYPEYKTLAFVKEPTSETRRDDPSGTIASIRVLPGRSWVFRALVGARSVLDAVPDAPQDATTTEWKASADSFGPIQVRGIDAKGAPVIVLQIQSERWGPHDFNDHPLAKLFFSELKTAAEQGCKPAARKPN